MHNGLKYLFITLILITTSCNGQVVGSKNPKEQCVGSQEKAIDIAEKEWLKIYGQNILKKKPFNAKLINDSIWIVEGTFYGKKGGVPYIEINAKTCKIVKITHGK